MGHAPPPKKQKKSTMTSFQPDQAQNLIYLYDLPKEETDSRKIAIAFEEQSGVTLDKKP